MKLYRLFMGKRSGRKTVAGLSVLAGILLLYTGIFGTQALAEFAGWSVKNTIDTSYSDPQSIKAADMDGDNDMDLLVSDTGAYEISWYENDGSQNFLKHVVSDEVSDPFEVFPADIDSDGDMDFTGTTDMEIAWWENDGSEQFTQHSVSTYFEAGTCVYAIDLDGDTDIDVVAGQSTYEGDDVKWFENDGNESFTEHNVAASFNPVEHLLVEDLDDDGHYDVLTASRSENTIAWFENDGSEVFTPHLITDTFSQVRCIATADIDGDGYTDIVGGAYTEEGFIWWENLAYDLFAEHDVVLFYPPYGLAAADIDNDGDIDFVTTSEMSGTSWFENDGSESFTQHVIDDSFHGDSICLADIDQDGWYDIAVTSGDGNEIAWWANEETGEGPVVPLPEMPTLVLIGAGLVLFGGYVFFRQRKASVPV